MAIMDDAFDALVATALFALFASTTVSLVMISLGEYQSSVIILKEEQVYAKQILNQLVLKLGSSEALWLVFANRSYDVQPLNFVSGTLIALPHFNLTLEPKTTNPVAFSTSLADYLGNKTLWKANFTVNWFIQKTSTGCAYTFVVLDNGSLLDVEVCYAE
jgi:hypothetical protein